MNYLSFDVGIKNLAYCIMEDCDKNICKIHNWNIINLIETNYKCVGCIENSCCDRKVTHKLCILDKVYYLCNLHKINYKDFINQEINKIVNVKILKIFIVYNFH